MISTIKITEKNNIHKTVNTRQHLSIGTRSDFENRARNMKEKRDQ